MANVIEIVIHATDAATAQIKGVEGAVTTMSGKLSGLAATLLSPAGLVAGAAAAGLAVAAMGNKLSDEIEILKNLSARTGASVNDMRALRQIMHEAGLSEDALTSALTIANRNLATQADNLTKVGITAKTPIEALLQLSDMVTLTGNSSRTTAAAFALLGRGGGELIPILNGLRTEVVEMHERLGDLDEATIRAAGSWDKMIDRMGTATKKFLDGIAAKFLKFIDSPFESARNAATQFGPMTEADARGLFGWKPEAVGGGGGAPGPPDPFASFRAFPDTGAGDVQRRGGAAAATTEQWQKLMDVWNEAEPVARKLAESIQEIDLQLTAIGISAEALGFAFLDTFDAILFQGKSAADALRASFMSAIRDIANQLAKIGIGLGLSALGTALGGPIGGVILGAGGRMAGLSSMAGGGGGNTYNIHTLDTATLRTAMMPGGTFNRAQDQVRIGSRY